tara:strand:- start:160 stop:996 length:837 start_codon:yes stop_codon:yes gene_type:complete
MVTVKEKYGFLPTSVWHLKKNKWIKSFINDDTAKGSTVYTKENGDKSWKSTRDSISEFNPDLATNIIKYWSNQNDLIIDPFSGRATRGVVAKKLGRKYIGFDVSPKVCEIVNNRDNQPQQTIFQESNTIKIINSDGCEMKELPDNYADMIFTCPPYWNIEDYNKLYEENIPTQLSDIKDYKMFLDKLKLCAKNCHRVLKDQKYCVWVVNDFRKDKKMYVFHSDLIQIMKENGLPLWDIVINELNCNVTGRVTQSERLGYTVKKHEYVLVFKKTDFGVC